MSKEELSKRCQQLVEAARSGLAWVTDSENAGTVGGDLKLISKELQRDVIRAQQLARAVERPMSIGVYGPSQAGKSYLVSVLAKPREGRLIAAVGDGMDFIEEINPEGDKEATGLVTRFTMEQPDAPADFPVSLKLLSEADVIRILANTFFRDGDNTEAAPTAAEIERRLAQARSAAGSPVPGLSEMDVWDIQGYFDSHFRGIAYAAELAPLWDEAAELLPRMPVRERTRLLGLLWGDYAIFSELYEQMADALAALGHPELAKASIECLKPRTASIIDVATLAGLDGMGDVSPVRLQSDNGKEAALPRPVVAALTAELVLPMKERPWDLFAEADLLDFPGVRERKAAKGSIENFAVQSEAPKKELFLRGKVGFLFERYVAQQDLTAMLLCVPPSNVNVAADLSAGVEEWISRTQGASPEERAQVDTMLFLVLTMFDRHLADPAGSLDPHQRFENRLEASLIAPFGGLRESWPLNWTPGKAFDNTFWLRNPNYPAEHVIRYENGREMELLPHKLARLGELKEGCLSSELVRRHIADAEAAWDAAIGEKALNDGGVEHLVNRLTPVARASVKERQITARAAELAAKLIRRLIPHYSDSDVEKRLDTRRTAAAVVLKQLRRAFDSRRFGRLLEELSITEQALLWRIERVPENIQLVNQDLANDEDGFDSFLQELEGIDGTEADEPAADDGAQIMSREAFQADAVMQAWHERMQGIAEQQSLDTHLGLSPGAISEITSEIFAAAKRLRFPEKLADELKVWSARQSGSATIAAYSASRVNQLVRNLGVEFLADGEWPKIKNKQTGAERRVFDEGTMRYHAFDLPESPPRRDRIFFQDWTFTLYRLFEDNAKSDQGNVINIEQNRRLGDTIQSLQDLS